MEVEFQVNCRQIVAAAVAAVLFSGAVLMVLRPWNPAPPVADGNPELPPVARVTAKTLPPGSFDVGPLRSGLVADWAFDEGRGKTARDTVGGHDGAIVGATWTAGHHGGGLHFNGAARVEIAGAADLNFGGPLTMMAWIRPESIPRGITFMNVLTHSGEPTSEIYLRLCNSLYAVGCYLGKHIPTEFRAPDDDVGQWVHLAGVYDGESWRIYRNGDLLTSHKTAAGPQPFEGPWAIGASPTDNARGFEGDIDEVRIYSRALGADEIKASTQLY